MKKLLLNSVLLTAGLGIYSEANAACRMTAYTANDVLMSVGRVVVRPSDEVGKILRKATFPISSIGGRNATVVDNCNASDRLVAELSQGYGLSSLGNNIYTTNIPGIGIRLYREAENASNFSGYYPYTRGGLVSGTRYSLASGYFVVEIVKIAEQTGSGGTDHRPHQGTLRRCQPRGGPPGGAAAGRPAEMGRRQVTARNGPPARARITGTRAAG